MSDPHPDGPFTAPPSSAMRSNSRPPEGVEAATKAHTALHALTPILPSPPPAALSSSHNLALSLLHDAAVSSSISSLLRLPESGSGDNPLCRWLYDTFQSRDATLQLIVLSYTPLLSGLYLKRVASMRRHLSGFEAVLLALYSHETASRPVRTAVSVTIPKLSNPSMYHEPMEASTDKATELHVGIESHALEPHSTLRATCRARMVGVALEMFYSKIRLMPSRSKLDFCEACEGWAAGEIGGLPWEVMQPALRILGHCLMTPNEESLHGKARGACRSLYARALRDIDPKAILATQSLIRMIDVEMGKDKEVDYTELPRTRVISI